MHKEQKEIQKEKLQQLFAEVTNQETEQSGISEPVEFIEIDVLQLPPRSKVHQKAKLSIHVNFHSPVWRFSFVIVLLAIILFFLYYFFGDQIMLLFT
jgi:hypothetical protein